MTDSVYHFSDQIEHQRKQFFENLYSPRTLVKHKINLTDIVSRPSITATQNIDIKVQVHKRQYTLLVEDSFNNKIW